MKRALLVLAALVVLTGQAHAQEPFISGTMTATDATVTLVTPLAGTVSLTLSGFGSATANFERTNDSAVTWVALDCITVSSGALTTSATANGTFLCAAGGAQRVRVRTNPYSSGTITAAIYMGQGSTAVELARALPAGSATIGAVTGSGTFTVGGTVTTTPPANATTNVTQFGTNNVATGTGAGGVGIPRVTVSNDSSLAANQSVNVSQFGGTNAVTGTGASGAGIPRVTVSNDSTVTANAGTNLNTSALVLDATMTGRLPAGASPANGESNTNTNLSRIGGFNFIFNGATWDRWTGAVSGTVTANIGSTNGLALDSSVNGILLSQASGTAGQKGPLIQGAVTTAAPSYTTGNTSPFSLDTSGSLRVNVVSGSTGNAAAGNTGAAVPTQADYTGINVGGTLRGQTGTNPTGSVFAAQADLASINGTTLGNTGSSLNVACITGCSGTTLGQTNKANSLPVTLAYDQGMIPINWTQLNGWPIATGVGQSTVATQRVALSQDSRVMIEPGAGSIRTTNLITVANAVQPLTGFAVGAQYAAGVAIVDGSGNQITSFGGGTQYTQNTALTIATTIGTMAIGRASAAAPTDVGADDRAVIPWYLRSGAIVGQPSFAGTLATTGNGTVGAGVQRVAIASDNTAFAVNNTQQGTASQNVAQIAGTTTVTAGVAGLIAVGGNVANAGTATANPVPVGGVFTTAPTTLTTGQTATLQFTAAQNAKQDLSTIAGTAPTTAGKLDVKGADGDVFVRQATGTNLHAVLDTTSTTAVTQATATNLNAAVVGTGTAGAPAGNILTIQGVASMTKLLVTPDSVALPANQSVNTAQFGGTNVSTGTGAGGAGIPRVTISNDSSLAANQSVNLSQFGGTTVTIGKQLAASSISVVTSSDDPILQALSLISNALRTSTSGKAGFLGTFGRPVTSTGDALDVNVKYPAASADPCLGVTKDSVAISQTASTKLLTGNPRRYVVCHLKVVGADAESLSLVEGTGAACGTNTAAIDGGTSAANGPNYAAGGGAADGVGAAGVLYQHTAGNDVCLLQSGSGRVAGHLTYALAN